MKERPIIMSAESVLALLDKRKKQTRRVFKFPDGAHRPDTEWVASVNPDGKGDWVAWGPKPVTDETSKRLYPDGGGFKCPYGYPGDRLWVKETWKFLSISPRSFFDAPFPCRWQYRADDKKCYGPVPKDKLPKQFNAKKWRSPLFMFRWASRITLEILNVRVEKLGSISNEDALAEGVDFAGCGEIVLLLGEHGQPAMSKVIFDFAKVWNSVNEKRGYPWAADPWVWVLELKIVEVLDGNDFIKRSVS